MFARACQVVPEIASFAVDDGFAYGIPEGMEPVIGSRVRIRVSGRRMRGFVTAILDEVPDKKLVPLDGIVGDIPSFAAKDLPLLRWCATHYVSPVSTILRRTVPPNIPRATRAPGGGNHRSAAKPIRSVLVPTEFGEAVADVLSGLDDDRSAMVVVPSVVEVDQVATALTERFGERVVTAHSDLVNKEITAAWVKVATSPGTVMVGTRETVLWPVCGLTHIVVVQDSRRVMKSPSTPTLGVREIAHARSQSAGVALDFLAPLPSLEVLTWATEESVPPGRCWPLVEVADRMDEPPSGSVLLERTRTAIASVANAGGRVFALVGRRGYARAFRCATCGELRRCERCRAAVGRDGSCTRCGHTNGSCPACGGSTWQHLGAGIGSVVDDLSRSLPGFVGPADEGTMVTVGTERDIRTAGSVRLAVGVDVDTLTMAPNYRAGEDALRLLVRLANLVERGRGNRCLVQTADSSQPVVAALRSGRYDEFMNQERSIRAAAGFPPSGDLIAIEVSPPFDGVDDLMSEVRQVVDVHGPAEVADRMRYLLAARDLDPARLRLRSIVRTLRDRGSNVRVDVDPIDL